MNKPAIVELRNITRKRFIPTTNFTATLLQELIQSSFNLDNFFRQELEIALNQLLADELTSFLGYSAYSLEEDNTGNSRNGYYARQLDTKVWQASSEYTS